MTIVNDSTSWSTTLESQIMLLESSIEQRALKSVQNCWNANMSFYLETSGGQNFNLYLDVVHFFNTSVN
jgi:hypothetical protein